MTVCDQGGASAQETGSTSVELRTQRGELLDRQQILRAAGGETLTMDGVPLTYGKRNQKDDSDFANPWFVSRGKP